MVILMHLRRLQAAISLKLMPVIEIHGLKWYCPTPLCVWRAHTLFEKELETIEWIDAMTPDDVLWDIGANVGVYSLYAASRGIRVVAFEPCAANYAVLVRNVQLNGLGHLIRVLPIAMTQKTKLATLLMSDPRPGYALHQCIQQYGLDSLRQDVISYSIDDFTAMGVPFPTAIKCDVDGNEEEILRGASVTLRDPRLKGVMIEFENGDEGYQLLNDAGLRLKWKRQSPMFRGTPYAKYWNHGFSRE